MPAEQELPLRGKHVKEGGNLNLNNIAIRKWMNLNCSTKSQVSNRSLKSTADFSAPGMGKLKHLYLSAPSFSCAIRRRVMLQSPRAPRSSGTLPVESERARGGEGDVFPGPFCGAECPLTGHDIRVAIHQSPVPRASSRWQTAALSKAPTPKQETQTL